MREVDQDMGRMAIEKLVLAELQGRLWHTTHPDRFKGILTCGAIMPDPDIPDAYRWKTSRGPEYYSYVRNLRCVSLFDFDQFEPDTYDQRFSSCSWRTFVPYQAHWGRSVWIEIDREKVAAQFISGPKVLAMWKAEQAHQHTIMPNIEAAHRGPLPRTAFKRAFSIGEGDSQLQPILVQARRSSRMPVLRMRLR